MKQVDSIYFKIIRTILPEITQKDITIRNYGWDYLVFIVKNKTVFRFPRYDWVSKKGNGQIMFAKQFKSISNLSIPLPTKQVTKGLTYLIYDLIPGKPLKPYWVSQQSKEVQNKLAKQLGLFMRKLHSFPLTKAEKIGLRRHNHGILNDEIINTFVSSFKPKITVTQWKWIMNRIKKIKKLMQYSDYKEVVIHRDIAPQHILINRDKKNLTGIIDFGDLAIGDPAHDFFRLNIYSKKFVSQVRKSYGINQDKNFLEREQAYRDISLFYCLEHYFNLGDRKVFLKFKKKLSKRINTKPRS